MKSVVARLVGRVEMHDHHQVGRGLLTVTPIWRTSSGRRGCAMRDPVLHLHLRDVEIGAEVEGDRDGEAAVGGRVRRHVEHVLDAVDLLLDRRHHGRGDDRRRWRPDTGPVTLMIGGAISGYCATGRRDERDPPEDHEHDRDNGGEDRPVDEEMRDPHRGFSLVGFACGRGGALLLRRRPCCPAAPASCR